MLTTVALVLLLIWLIGVAGLYTVGWYIHILLVVALFLFFLRIVRGKNPNWDEVKYLG